VRVEALLKLSMAAAIALDWPSREHRFIVPTAPDTP